MLELANVKFNILKKNQIYVKNENLKIIITVNAQFVVLANENQKFKNILNSSYTTIDGQIPYFLLKVKYRNLEIEKISGADLIYDFCEYARNYNKRIFLLGGLEISNKLTVEKLREKYGIEIEGYSPPFKPYPFNIEHNQNILNKIEKFKPHILFVAFGAPKQEFWIWDNKEKLESIGVEYAIGCGGTFEFVSGIRKRAPKTIQKIGLEGVFRFLQEPNFERFKRLLVSLKIFKYSVKWGQVLRS